MLANGSSLAEVAQLVGDPARANILLALMDGRALTATELAYAARVTPQTTSAHLGKLTAAGLLQLEKQGRHRYFRLASPLVAQMLESVLLVAADGPPRYRPRSRVDSEMREARTCYDHLAGRLAVALADALAARGHIVLEADGGEVTAQGMAFFDRLGLDLSLPRASRRAFCRPCLDWTERRYHLAGHVGAALLQHCLREGWLARRPDTRAVRITPLGGQRLGETFGPTLFETGAVAL